MNGRAVTLAVSVACAVALLGGCSEGGDEATTPSAEVAPGAVAGQPDPDVFCDRLLDLQSGEVRAIEDLRRLFDDLLSTAPAELKADVEYFVQHSRAVSEAFAEAGAPEQQVDAEAILSTLDPETRAFVRDLASSAETGEVAPGSVGTVTRYSLESC